MLRPSRLPRLAIVCSTLFYASCTQAQQIGSASAGTGEKSIFRKIYDEDQKNRNDIAGDAQRRAQVRQLINDGKAQSGEDYYYAAFVYQHGQQPSDYLYAHVLAVTAVSKGFGGAIWLCAATLDRYLRSVQHSQIFGTQVGSLDASPTTQEPYDRRLVSDTLRAMWCVAPLSAQDGIVADVRAGKPFRSTRTCPVP